MQISKYKCNENKKNYKATWNRNELTIFGVTRSDSKALKQKQHGAGKN